jgi:glycosyltransferase involved in cell wall biosynthesis
MCSKIPNDQSCDINVAILIPCYNEGVAIASVVNDFRSYFPSSPIYVYDNNSSDNTASEAFAAGAIIRYEKLQGKGHVVRRMFADIEADVFVLVDGDATYPAECAPLMLQALLKEGLDMVTAVRRHKDTSAYRPGHQFGNRLFTMLISRLFGNRCSDILSGYRAFSKRFVKSFPATSSGFEIETEFTIHALEMGMAISEVECSYFKRPSGSQSKLSTYRDGVRIFSMIFSLLKKEKPLFVTSIISGVLLSITLGLGVPFIVLPWLETGLVTHIATAVLCMGLGLLAFTTITLGIILDAITCGRREVKRIAYLSFKGPQYKFSHDPNTQTKAGGETHC